MQRPLYDCALRALIGLLMLSMAALMVHGQETTIENASKSAYDFDSLSGVIDADQVDYFSGNWSYALPLGEVEGAGGLSLPLTMRYSSAVTGTDRLIKLGGAQQISTLSKGTVTLNNATWVGLGWNLEFGAIKVTGGYELRDTTSPINHPFSFNLSMVLPDGSHRLVRQLDDSRSSSTSSTPLAATNVYFAEKRRFMDIRWNFNWNAPLASTWTVKTVSGLTYTFGAVTIGGHSYGMNQTVKGGAVLQGRFNELMPEMVYQWNLAEIKDQAGNTIRFKYVADGPVTTVRDWAKERAETTRSFRNLLDFADLDSRYPNGIVVGQTTANLTVVKTYNTGHLSEVAFAGADDVVVRKITTETSAREDIHIARHRGVAITYDNYFGTHPGDLLPYGHYLSTNNQSYRMYDGISSAHRLDALKVTDADGSQLARYTFDYEDDKSLQKRPPVAAGDNARTLLLQGISVTGTGNSAADNLPPYRFANTLADSYRITKIVTPAGGEMKIDYERIPKPDTTWTKHINYDEAFFERSRRIKRRIWDSDGSGGAAADTTSFVYVRTDAVMETDNANRLRRITFPVVDEILPGRHGKMRRDYVGEADLNALGLSAGNKKHESERDIRRGLLKAVAYRDASGGVVQREQTDWQVTTQGTWTGRWQAFYHPGIPQQAYWLRAVETTDTRDGASTTTALTHNAGNGLVATRTLRSGTRNLRVTDTSYHADQITSSPVSLAFGRPVLDAARSTGERVHAAFLSQDDPPTASVEAFLNANSGIESTGIYDFTAARFSVSDYDAVRIRGVLGTDQLQGGDNMYAAATVTVDWKDGGMSTAGSLTYNVPVSGGLPDPREESFDVVVPVPAIADSAHVNLELLAAVYKEAQTVYRKIRVYARDIEVTGMSADDPEDVFLKGAHILDRPHVVTVKDGSGRRLQSTRHRYGRFNVRGTPIVMPDTTSVWLDEDGDGRVDADEWIDRRVATDYDAYGNPIASRDAHGTVTSTVMGYGKMRSVAAFTGASSSQTAAVVFDDYADWDELDVDAPGAWSKTGTGTPVLDDGALFVNNAVARRSLPANAIGVLEIDVMAGAENEQTAVTLAGGGTSTERIRWVFDTQGVFRAQNGTTLTAAGASYTANQWYHVKIQWSGSTWWARVDGVRYPASGAYAMRSGGTINQVKLSNGASAASAAFDNLRAWPSGAQPSAMTTYDPVTLDAIAVTDPNGHTTRFLRDGLGRVVQMSDGAGRKTAQRDHTFSRGISGTSTYNSARPNRQAVIAYPSRDGHKDLSGDGHRTLVRGTGDRLEEGVSLETAGPYVVADGETVDLRASVRIRLTTGFRANDGSGFRAAIDPLAGADQVTGSGDVAWNRRKAAKRSVKLGPSSVLETGRISGRVTARADFHPASASSGKTVIMAFEDGADHVRMVYDRGRVKLESRIDGSAASRAMGRGYNASWPWARVEMELLPTGRVNAWLYGHETSRFKGASASVSVPVNWTPAFKSKGESGDGYLAGLYVGKAETAVTYYDGLARQIQTRAGAESRDIVTQTKYNRAGKPERLLGPVYQPPSHTYGALSETAAGSRITRTSYDDDPLLRVSRIIPPGHNSRTAVDTRYGYWGSGSGLGRSYVTVDDEKSISTTRVYDPYGRMIHTIANSAGTEAATRNNRTSFAYDALDRLTSATQPRRNRTAYAYDTLGRTTSRHHLDADGATTYKYDDLGRVRYSQDARQRAIGKVTYTVYDDFGRVTRVGEASATYASLDPERSYPFEGDATSWRSRMTYDGDAATGDDIAGGSNYAQGRLTRVEENTDADAAAEVTHRYAYDHLGNVRVKRVSIAGLNGEKTAEYAHDLAGRVTKLTYPDGSQARYAYDASGRLSRVRDARGKTLAAYTHTAAGNIASHVVGTGAGDRDSDAVVTGTYAYNAREWVTGIDYPGRFTMTQRYDAAGNVTGQRYRRAAAETFKAAAYTYDALYRLTGFNLDRGASTRTYRYDRNGNITRISTNGAVVDYVHNASTTPNRTQYAYIAGTGLQRYTYNRNGWTTRNGADTVRYDYRGLTTGVGTARYLMDPDRRRVKKTVGTATTYYLRGPGGSVLAEYDGQTLSTKYVYAGTRRIARITGSSASYYLADHLGSTRSLIDGEGTVTAAYDYWPYGKVLSLSGSGATHFRFTGHERDVESGLDYMLARSYAYDVGRFLRPDPMQDEYPGISPYAYANNNPLKYVDPDGNSHHEPQDQIDLNQFVQDRFDEGGVEVANAIANLPGYVQSGAVNGAGVVADYALDLAETSVKSGIVISDALSEGSIAGAAAGTVGVGIGIATRNPALAAGSVKFTYTMLSINTGANAASTVLKGVDATAFDGSREAAYSQTARLVFGSGGSKIIGMVGSRFVAATSSSVTGTFYRSSATGQFVSNRMGFATTAAVDATSVGINISLDSLIDP